MAATTESLRCRQIVWFKLDMLIALIVIVCLATIFYPKMFVPGKIAEAQVSEPIHLSMARVDHALILHAGAMDAAYPAIEPDDPLGRYRQSTGGQMNSFVDHIPHAKDISGATRTAFPITSIKPTWLKSTDYQSGYKDRPAWSF